MHVFKKQNIILYLKPLEKNKMHFVFKYIQNTVFVFKLFFF